MHKEQNVFLFFGGGEVGGEGVEIKGKKGGTILFILS